jgi:hypothetical protein
LIRVRVNPEFSFFGQNGSSSLKEVCNDCLTQAP